ncbi:MAG TPA: cytochrome b/b6 domain-containing protein [Gaiellaceae bacterium]|nr:cytochrome b/b6 domain-containing protein [Gaiellaceae bacterium]
MPGSASPTSSGRASSSRASPPPEPESTPRLLPRFGRTERALHWIHASAFFCLLGTGLVLWLPALSAWVGRRALVKDVHVWTAVAWAVLVALVIALGDRRALLADWREIERLDRDDRRWLTGRRAPQGRFNAGQKLNAIVTASFALLFAVSGLLLWLAARDSRFRWEGPIVVHDALTLFSVVLVLGHLYLAVIHPSTRHALRGMTLGDVREDWAREHHPKWAAGAGGQPPVGPSCPGEPSRGASGR